MSHMSEMAGWRYNKLTLSITLVLYVFLGSYGYRLVDGPTLNAGRVEIQGDGRWMTVCDAGFDMNSANVTCNYLGYR